MSLRSILIYPDQRLKKICAPVSVLDDSITTLIADMFETMYDAPGIGLAAPQIGVMSRIFVMDCAIKEAEQENTTESEAERCPMVFINPEITWASEETSVYNEGCLSLPDQFADITRPSQVKMRWLDEKGIEHEELLSGLAATCAQHELDHLNGKMFIDYLGPVRRSMITNKMKKLKKNRTKNKG